MLNTVLYSEMCGTSKKLQSAQHNNIQSPYNSRLHNYQDAV